MTVSTQIDTTKVAELLQALEAGEQQQASVLLDEITQMRERELYLKLSELTSNLHQTLDDLSDDNLMMQTKHDIPDAAERLEYVINTTEEASNKTLESAEKVIAFVETLESELQSILTEDQLASIHSALQMMQSELNNIMLAQSFQDLTGQVLNRVILIISSLEQSLISLIEQAGHDYASIPDRKESKDDAWSAQMKGIGPNVTKKSQADSVSSQDDVDDLLGELGI